MANRFLRRQSIAGALAASLLAEVACVPGAAAGTDRPEPPEPRVVRTAVIGGMILTGLWPEISRRFEEATGYRVEVTVSGPRPVIAAAFRAGQADLLTMHSGDITTELVADGYGRNMRPWIRNDLALVGPKSDPAGVRGLTNGAAALRRIADTQSPFVDFQGIGSREVTGKLWKMAEREPKGAWVLKDESKDHLDILRFAEAHNAYVIVGRIPVILGKMSEALGMRMMVESDPAMRRPYIVMEANPDRLPGIRVAGARALADFLLSDPIQAMLSGFKSEAHGGIALFHPVRGPP